MKHLIFVLAMLMGSQPAPDVDKDGYTDAKSNNQKRIEMGGFQLPDPCFWDDPCHNQ